MMSLKSDNEKIVGVLHVVVEDAGDWGFERLKKEGFCEEVLDGLRSVTKTSDE